MQQGTPRNTFSKAEKLKLKDDISALFGNSQVLKAYPIKVIYRLLPIEGTPPAAPLQVLITVPKRSFKKAYQRNRIKRLIREAHRQHKHALVNTLLKNGKAMHLGYIYVARDEWAYSGIEAKLKTALFRLEKVIVKPRRS